MAPQTFPVTRHPNELEFMWEDEVTPGTAPASPNLEICHNITLDHVGQDEPETGYGGVQADTYGIYRMQQNGRASIDLDHRNDGYSGSALARLIGNGADSVGTVAGGIYPHTVVPSLSNARVATSSIYKGYSGDTSNYEVEKYFTVESWNLTSNPSGAVRTSISGTGRYPAFVSRPSPANVVGIAATYTRTRMHGNRSVYSIYNSAGALYSAACRIYGANITISRVQAELIPDENASDVADIVPGLIQFSGSFNFIYTGAGAATVYRDMANFAELGDSSHIHSFVWTDADGKTLEIRAYNLKLTTAPPDSSGNTVKGVASFTSYDSFAKVFAVSNPAITRLVSVIMGSKRSGAFS